MNKEMNANEKDTRRLILASASPRRHEILTAAGIPHEIRTSDADETLPDGISPADAVQLLSARKARAVCATAAPDEIVLAADTVVCHRGVILGKPGSEGEAREMLLALSGDTHQVFTGITLCDGTKTVTQYECSHVHMREISGEEIDAYIRTGEPMDKAGAYGIQGRAGLFVRAIEGDYFNIVGLPLCRVGTVLREHFAFCSSVKL